jgi:hypothetical protein
VVLMPISTPILPAHVRLLEALVAGGHPVRGCSGSSAATVRLSFAPGATPAQVGAALAFAAAFDWSQAAHDTWLLARRRAAAKSDYDHQGEQGKVLRAIVLTLLDELNILRAAVVPPLAPRTATQARTAIRNKIDAD